MLDQEFPSPGKRNQRRWRMAFTAIYFTRVLCSLSKKVLDNQNRLLGSFSYVAISINDDAAHNEGRPLVDVDHNTLIDMVKNRSLESLHQLGGAKQVVAILLSDAKEGISDNEADLAHRREVFGANRYQKPPTKSFFSFVFEALKDSTMIILSVCSVLSLGFGIKQHGPKDGWYDGGSIIVAIVLVIAVSSVSNFKQSKQFEKLSDVSNDIKVRVVRDGRHHSISIFDIVVGDVISLKIGDQIPADGLFLDGYSLKLDESSMTGESEHVEVDGHRNPFVLSGTKVIDGFGSMIVTSVGMNTAWGEMMSSLTSNLEEQTPLQARLSELASYIGKVGLSVAILVLAVLMIRYFTGSTRDENGQREFNGSKTKVSDVLNSVVGIVAAAVTILVVAIPEGLPLSVTLTLAYSMKRMMKDNAMVRKLSACETMGSATTICTDKTGTLTLNQMKVIEFWLGKESIEDGTSSKIEPAIYELLQEGIALNTTGTVGKSHTSLDAEISGSPTEKAILSWAVFDLGIKIIETKLNCKIIHVEAFNSEKKRSGVWMRKSNDKTIHTHWKGAAEMILAMCSNYYLRNGAVKAMNRDDRLQFETIIQSMAAKSLRCIAFAHKKLKADDRKELSKEPEETEFTLMGIVGLKDPCRPGVSAAIESCKKAGVIVKMITGDNLHTARTVAIECGILSPEDDMDRAVVEGVQFRNFSPEDRTSKIDEIRVMARSSPFDKLLMVQCLKQKGHVVGVTGDGTNDAPALKEADIGLAMGIQGTEVAKESADIIILDDNFSSVVTVLQWGRCVYSNIQKFLQFQLTVNVAALVINFAAAVSSGEVPLTAVQLLWVNLIMDTLGALGLATEQPTSDLMEKKPVGRWEPLITKIMWRNLIAQALYQVAILLALQFKAQSIFGVNEKVKNTIIFNTFVLCQVFNEFNSRNMEKKNIFKGIHRNKLFLVIIGITILLQVLMVELLTRFASTERLNWGQWGACIGIAALTWPIGFLVKCIPVPF
ncbi:putative calcium-transporting ATPase 13, plasma membrane-type [Ricinus communis]|uniref:Calcium-transporting ATPase n=1 Tax=Ricinus communis TaxID=3988 RepID=B9REP4_RICCO|nr:putative calcium-transporting ATPase 13, plasma membrane-type [Ricinus communis]EEF49665.1 cation-transporting atpase plant, putative [Ricinus communis]|eukprot:XP_002512213.1 putative calcium-transporting ATPase 13, plasma membrane-type [Ricinus communis]